MLERTMQRNSLTLAGKVYCFICNSPMTLLGGAFYCPNSFPDICAQIIEETSLIRAVIEKLANRLTTDETMQGVDSKVKQTLEPQLLEQTAKLISSESEIARLREIKPTNPEAPVELTEINSSQAALAYDSMLARDEIERMEFIADSDGIRETAKDLRTYLQNPDPDLAQELLDLLVTRVNLTPQKGLIVFDQSAPGPSDELGGKYDTITLT